MGITQKIATDKYANENQRHLEYPKNPVKYSKNELDAMKEPPLLGENTDEILRKILDFS